MLNIFLRNGIDEAHLEPLDDLVKSSQIDEVKVLNSYLPLSQQRIIFGALRNIHSTTDEMRAKLRIARAIHENPKTVERALEMIDSLCVIAPYVDEFLTRGKMKESESKINEFSRAIYRKANRLGFYPNLETQLKQAQIRENEVEDFFRKLADNIEIEVENVDETAR
jgi:predicted ATP-grasp superfamily ATP-dependent carboligase